MICGCCRVIRRWFQVEPDLADGELLGHRHVAFQSISECRQSADDPTGHASDRRLAARSRFTWNWFSFGECHHCPFSDKAVVPELHVRVEGQALLPNSRPAGVDPL